MQWQAALLRAASFLANLLFKRRLSALVASRDVKEASKSGVGHPFGVINRPPLCEQMILVLCTRARSRLLLTHVVHPLVKLLLSAPPSSGCPNPPLPARCECLQGECKARTADWYPQQRMAEDPLQRGWQSANRDAAVVPAADPAAISPVDAAVRGGGRHSPLLRQRRRTTFCGCDRHRHGMGALRTSWRTVNHATCRVSPVIYSVCAKRSNEKKTNGGQAWQKGNSMVRLKPTRDHRHRSSPRLREKARSGTKKLH